MTLFNETDDQNEMSVRRDHRCQDFIGSEPSSDFPCFSSSDLKMKEKDNSAFINNIFTLSGFCLPSILTLLHSEWPKLYEVLAILSAIGLTLKAP